MDKQLKLCKSRYVRSSEMWMIRCTQKGMRDGGDCEVGSLQDGRITNTNHSGSKKCH